MNVKILVTGGAGFIGSHLVDALIEKGYKVRIYDNLDPQVHGKAQKIPEYLNKKAEFIKGDVRDRQKLKGAIKDIDIIFHEASAVGVGQSMYEIEKYVDANTRGTAVLLDILVNEPNKVKKVLVASSMSIYGEGAYKCKNCGVVYPKLRPREQLKKRDWEMKCPHCGSIVKPMPTNEDKPLYPTSVYAITKRDQEELVLSTLQAYSIPAVALRYFNVYGPRQSLSNPYTGALAIFISRLLNKNPPLIFEDGNQSRDFVYVQDIVKANLLAMNSDKADWENFNVGTGIITTIKDVADVLGKNINPGIKPEIVNKFRAGDIRHCYADIAKIKGILGFEPDINFERGIKNYLEWVKTQKPTDNIDKAIKELEKKGLTI